MTNHGTTMMEVRLEKVRFHAFHGMLPQERKIGNDFEVDISAAYFIKETNVADDLRGSLCYAELYELATDIMSQPSNTLEHVAATIGNTIQKRWNGLETITVSVSKMAPPIRRFHGMAKVTWCWKRS